eukprot:TRINITY_DN11663_c0_g1_i1.p1 TRINITY_DN11663_c0_g1~~TRINITY_DN11663_c0_g1_i1.p1  ORF type:complete len:264 (-),score=30.51 TRINITY_DN11663_c0_g1_i1:621-1304(-)
MATTTVMQVCKALPNNTCPLAHNEGKRKNVSRPLTSISLRWSRASVCAEHVDARTGNFATHWRQQATKRRQQGMRPACAEVTPPMGANSAAVEGVTTFKHILLPILDRNPYLSEATRQVTATAAGLAKKFGADVTVVVIDEDAKESITDHEARMKSIRWHMAEGGFEDFGLLERMGEGKKPAAVVGEVADDLNLDLVVMSMESIHHKHIDGNLLAEFVPCPILLLPL